MKFFFDTANSQFIKQTWAKLEANGVRRDSVLGVTTNPNAMSKINCNTLEDFEVAVYKLTRVVSDIRGDANGMVYVQLPNSHASLDECVKWANYVSKLGDRNTNVVLKVPPYTRILKWMDMYNESVTRERAKKMISLKTPYDFNVLKLGLNVTGCADATTALLCGMHPSVKYVSIIPGRMEEVGINANAHLEWLSTRPNKRSEIITGSMRTIEGVKAAIERGTIPTIGERVWNLFTETDYQEFKHWWPENVPEHLFEFDVPNSMCIPITNEKNIDLSHSFFKQMDELGTPLYEEFKLKP